MLKKSITMLFTMFLALTFGTAAFASETEGYETGLQLIEDTNAAIDAEIAKAVAAADALQSQYFTDIQSVEGSNVIVDLREEQSSLEAQLLNETNEERAAAIRDELAQIETEVSNAEAVLSEESSFFAERTDAFNADLDRLINDLDVLTREMTAQTIAKVAEYGITAECVWKHVKIAHRWVWIDPVQVVGH
ncbi:hypothetical protein [Peribacillus sp. SCS-155]|uniref:hypothetical protein n=1 Tax=Peribacillus sedimenti TaxID=3115297 RepID=UPI003905B3F6